MCWPLCRWVLQGAARAAGGWPAECLGWPAGWLLLVLPGARARRCGGSLPLRAGVRAPHVHSPARPNLCSACRHACTQRRTLQWARSSPLAALAPCESGAAGRRRTPCPPPGRAPTPLPPTLPHPPPTHTHHARSYRADLIDADSGERTPVIIKKAKEFGEAEAWMNERMMRAAPQARMGGGGGAGGGRGGQGAVEWKGGREGEWRGGAQAGSPHSHELASAHPHLHTHHPHSTHAGCGSVPHRFQRGHRPPR